MLTVIGDYKNRDREAMIVFSVVHKILTISLQLSFAIITLNPDCVHRHLYNPAGLGLLGYEKFPPVFALSMFAGQCPAAGRQ